MFSIPIRTKIILSAVLPLVLIFGVVSLYGLRWTQAETEQRINKQLDLMTRYQSERLSAELDLLAEQAKSLLAARQFDSANPGIALRHFSGNHAIVERLIHYRGDVPQAAYPKDDDASLLDAARPLESGWHHIDLPDGQTTVALLHIPDTGSGGLIVTVSLANSRALAEATADIAQPIFLRVLDAKRRWIHTLGNNFDARVDYWVFERKIGKTGWSLELLMARDLATARADELSQELVRILVLSLIGLLLLVWYTAAVATRPIIELDRAVREISAGNLDIRLHIRRRDELGRLARAISDLGARLRQREQQVKESTALLESRVRERTAELEAANRQLEAQIAENHKNELALRHASEEAQQANRAKSEFLSNMSHELRTPLNGVLGYAQLLQREPNMNQRQLDNLSAIESCGHHLLTLINDVLDISKIEAGRMEVDLGPTNLEKLFKGIHDIVAQRAEAKNLELRMEIDPGLPRAIRTDGTKLRQVLLNLLGNAVKFTAQGSITLRAHEGSDGHLHMAVADTGMGIPNDKLESIFDAFRQAEGGVTHGGTGLGLAINQRLIALLEGRSITVESELGKGSEFRFSIPLEVLDESELDDEADSLMGANQALKLAADQQIKVLVVDDRLENRDILHRLLEDAGFEVEEATEGGEALRKLKATGHDLVLMDIRMPGMSGTEAMRHIRDDSDYPPTKVIAVTASVFPHLREQIGRAGFDDFIGKPIRVGELFHKIRQHLGIEYQDAEAEPETAAEPTAEHETGHWSPELAKSVAARITEAAELGDMMEIMALTEELSGQEGVPARDLKTIADLAGAFDFDALIRLAERIQA